MQFRGLGTEIFPHGVGTLQGEQRRKTNKGQPQGHWTSETSRRVMMFSTTGYNQIAQSVCALLIFDIHSDETLKF